MPYSTKLNFIQDFYKREIRKIYSSIIYLGKTFILLPCPRALYAWKRVLYFPIKFNLFLDYYILVVCVCTQKFQL